MSWETSKPPVIVVMKVKQFDRIKKQIDGNGFWRKENNRVIVKSWQPYLKKLIQGYPEYKQH